VSVIQIKEKVRFKAEDEVAEEHKTAFASKRKRSRQVKVFFIIRSRAQAINCNFRRQRIFVF